MPQFIQYRESPLEDFLEEVGALKMRLVKARLEKEIRDRQDRREIRRACGWKASAGRYGLHKSVCRIA